MAMVLIKVIQSYTPDLAAPQKAVQCLSVDVFSDSYPGLSGVDWGVVCLLIELRCLRGCCLKLSTLLKVTGATLYNHFINVMCTF